jgi:hypothetical protein
MTTAAVVRECTYDLDPDDPAGCDQPAVYELSIHRPSGQFTGDRTEFACEKHTDALVGDDVLLVKDALDGRGRMFWRGFESTPATGPVTLLTVPVPAKYRPSKWSTPWILLLGLIGYELWAVGTSKAGGPLSHLVWWTYGERWSLRWWLCSSALNGLGLWAAAHFMFEWPEVKELLITIACAVGVGLIGWFVTR